MSAFTSSAHRIEQVRDVDILDTAVRVGARLKKVATSEWAGPCPVCGGTDRFSVNITRKVFNCRGYGGGDVIAMTQHTLGMDFREAVEFLTGSVASNLPPPRAGEVSSQAAQKIQAVPSDNRLREIALNLFDEATPPGGTPVDRYWSLRGLELPESAADEAIRYHANCPFAGSRTPAMIALVRHVVTNEPLGIHRTALNSDGSKASIDGKSKLALGPVAGGAIKLTPDLDVTLCLGIAEGIESAASLRHIPEFGRSPIWSVLNAGGTSSFPLLPGIETLWVGVDNDAAGIKASNTVAVRWREAGREAFLIRPTAEGRDLNDLARGAA